MSSDAITQTKRPSVLGGAMIIAGTAVGAGMFSIPVMTAGVWFTGSVLLLIYTWFCMYMSGLMILEANLNYPTGSSFHTVTKDLLGNGWATINGLSIAFVLYILTYAYISAGGSMLQENLSARGLSITPAMSGLLFAGVVAVIVWISTKAVDRLCTILIGGMVIAFVMSAGGMVTEFKPAILFNTADPDAHYLPYALVALPFLLTSFGFHGNVPGLVKYYQKDAKSVVRSLFIGSLISLVIYILWQFAAQGNVPRANFKQVMAEGGNITALLGQMKAVIRSDATVNLLNLFSYMALASSFLGVSLGLFDYLADFFKFKDNGTGRLKSALFTFIPPAILAVLYPDGFLYAIGFAGLAATIWAVIVPALMAKATRRRNPMAAYRVPGGDAMIIFIILFGVINAVTHILSMMNLLPVYR